MLHVLLFSRLSLITIHWHVTSLLSVNNEKFSLNGNTNQTSPPLRVITWPECWPLIGQTDHLTWMLASDWSDRSCDLDTGLSLVTHLPGVLRFSWQRPSDTSPCSSMHPGCWPLIGQKLSLDLDTGLWLAYSYHISWILASDWSRKITCLGCWPLNVWKWSREQNTFLWLVEINHVTRILASDWL